MLHSKGVVKTATQVATLKAGDEIKVRRRVFTFKTLIYVLCELDSFFFVFLLILLDVIYCLVPVTALFIFFESFCLYSLNGLINGKCPSILIFLSKLKKLYFQEKLLKHFYTRDIEILGWCPAGPVLPHGQKVPL